ncbi:Plasma membrane t-SNARE, secretory vesicle fusion [Apophysomyces ossiformis]|uniref:Plasma membrane t-SNARE, secretory vesicle fusion n=1 Tax=Apophysomyces ossiformis TaxID=679940 RepID=A0A8H7BKY5_9FUNG|nr:Plasma membrane t-SNARE, secretory vesicle fusion [Apophysomyces ossiformis]
MVCASRTEILGSHRADGGRTASDEFGSQRTPAGFRQPMLNLADRYPTELPPRTGVRDTIDEQNTYEMRPVAANIGTMEGFFDEIAKLKNDISLISDNVDQISMLHKSALVSFNEQQTREISQDLERIQNGTRKQTLDIKNRIQDLESTNSRLPNDANTELRRTQASLQLI